MEVNVLMIDDHELIIEGYKSILSYNPHGYDVKTTQALSCENAYELITTTSDTFDLVTIDYTMPPYPEKNIHNGSDLIPLLRKHLPDTKIMMLTTHSEALLLFNILKNHNPEGLLVKSDFDANDFTEAFHTVIQGQQYHSSTIVNLNKQLEEKAKMLDYYNRQIILLLNRGIKTKNLPEHLYLSKSAVDKRKAYIKEFFDIEKGNDEDILREARKQGFI
ncbi:response regulator transcription factor [Flavobacterium sp.]|jgi:DNA-binding NarL/FixJ family response regulator|uniref:response regulator transcription factor n=1 Tax=Flavobacterium sp. TaxID=239 RepID=UPI0037C01C5F